MSPPSAAPTAAGLASPNVLEVDTRAIAHNVAAIRQHIGRGVWLCASVKADAYGFGLVPIATAAVDSGADALAVSRLADAVTLRDAGLLAPILMYAGDPVTPEFVEACAEHRLIATVHDDQSLQTFAHHRTAATQVFVKVDAGLRRFGFSPAQLSGAVESLRHAGVTVAGIYTHLHISDAGGSRALESQYQAFVAAAQDVSPRPMLMAASSRVLAVSPSMCLDAVDPGRAVVGLVWGGHTQLEAGLAPALARLATRIVSVRDVVAGDVPLPRHAWLEGVDRLGVIPMGRRDGLPALATASVLVRGRRAPLVGPAALEHSRVDLTGIQDAMPGDEVVVIGSQGSEAIWLADVVAAHPEIPSVAIALGVGATVRRVYR